MIKRSCFSIAIMGVCLSMQPALAERYTPSALCAIINNTEYESLTLPLGLSVEYPSGSVQSTAITMGDSEQPGGNVAANNDVEFIMIFIDADNDGTPEVLASASCLNNTGTVPTGCTVTQNITLPTVTEDTTYRGRVMLSYGAATPADGCGDNEFGDSEDFLVIVDVQEFITFTDVSQPEDDGPITVTATLSHDVRDGAGFVSFTVDYLTADGTATIADNDYTAASGTLTFNGQAGDMQTFTVNPTVDLIPEGDQTILVSLQNLSNTTHGIDISDTATLTLVEDDSEVALTIVKSADDYSPNIGTTIVFTLEVSNAGPDAAVGTVVQDTVPAGFSSITAVSSPPGSSLSVAGNTVSWTGVDVPVGGSVSATFSAVVLPP